MRASMTALVSCSVLFMIGCASGSGSSSTAAPRNVLTSEMLLDTQESELYAALQRLRPQWLRARGAPRVSGGNLTVAVYVNEVRRGEVDVLRSIPLENVRRVRFFTGSEATTRWGTGVAGGVISVTLARR